MRTGAGGRGGRARKGTSEWMYAADDAMRARGEEGTVIFFALAPTPSGYPAPFLMPFSSAIHHPHQCLGAFFVY